MLFKMHHFVLLLFVSMAVSVLAFSGAKTKLNKLSSGGASTCTHRSSFFMMADKYCVSNERPSRRQTSTVQVGPVPIGSEHPVVKQTMTTTITRDVESSVQQVMKIADQGGMLARLTVQGRFEADACSKIRESLNEKGCVISEVD